jgi:hypothetical protein
MVPDTTTGDYPMSKTNDAALAVLAPSGPAGYQEIVREFPF